METKEELLTFGERMIAINPRPTDDQGARVTRVRAYAAALINEVYDYHGTSGVSDVDNILFNNAVQKIVDAQMAAVKMITNDQ